MAPRQRREWGENLTSPLRQSRAAQHAVGHVGAHPLPQPGQRLAGISGTEEAVEATQNGGGVRAAAAGPRADGNMLLHRDGESAAVEAAVLQKLQSGGGGQIFLVGGEKAQIGAHPHASARTGLQSNPIRQGHRLHHHSELVIAVAPSAQHIQGQIQLGRRFHREPGHDHTLLSKALFIESCGPPDRTRLSWASPMEKVFRGRTPSWMTVGKSASLPMGGRRKPRFPG